MRRSPCACCCGNKIVGQVGASEFRSIGVHLLEEAAPSGVDQVTFSGVRVAGNSGLTGHEVVMTVYYDENSAVAWRIGP
jgi:hypothetical protein